MLGWCAIRLDERCRRSLENQSNGFGLKTQYLLVEGDGALIAADSRSSTVEMALRIVADKHPKSTLRVTDTYHMQILNSHYTDENMRYGIDPVYLQTMLTRTHDLKAPQPPRPLPPAPAPVDPAPMPIRMSPLPMPMPMPPPPMPPPPLPPIRQCSFSHEFSDSRPKVYFMNREDFSDIPMDYRYPFLGYRQPRP